jgi:hypothetical protein
VDVGAVSSPFSFTVENTGGSPTTALSTNVSGADALEFEVVADACGAALPAFGSCAVEVRMKPTGAGSKQALLVVGDAVVTASATLHGAGDCSPASPSDVQYVDPTLGVDDPLHGAQGGTCAYKTLTYALAHAQGQIVLAYANYQGDVAGEALPFLLSGAQQLKCDSGGGKAILKAAASAGSYSGVVNLAGTNNVVDGCSIDGNGHGGYCVVLSSSATSPATPHQVTNCEVKNCGNVAVHVDDLTDNVELSQNELTLNGLAILWDGTHTGSTILNNTFTANTGFDVYCATSSPGITGSGNVAGGGSIQCQGCASCAF